MSMTLLDAMEKRFNEEKEKLKEECKPGIQYVKDITEASNYVTGPCFEKLYKQRVDFKVNRIELMCVDKTSKGAYFQQFLVEFEDNTTQYIYVFIGEADGKKA